MIDHTLTQQGILKAQLAATVYACGTLDVCDAISVADDILTRIIAEERELFAENPCVGKLCSFYTHYVVNYYPTEGEPKLEHDAFHAAEENCNAVQKRCEEWMNNPANKDKPFPKHLEELANKWERKVCA